MFVLLPTGEPAQTGTAVVTLNLTDINDNAPVVVGGGAGRTDAFVVRRGDRLGTRIGVIKATDVDTADNGPPFEFSLACADGAGCDDFTLGMGRGLRHQHVPISVCKGRGLRHQHVPISVCEGRGLHHQHVPICVVRGGGCAINMCQSVCKGKGLCQLASVNQCVRGRGLFQLTCVNQCVRGGDLCQLTCANQCVRGGGLCQLTCANQCVRGGGLCQLTCASQCVRGGACHRCVVCREWAVRHVGGADGGALRWLQPSSDWPDSLLADRDGR